MTKKAKTVKPPSAAQMKVFAKRFTKDQWAICIEDTEFLEACSTDLKKAEAIAVDILSDE